MTYWSKVQGIFFDPGYYNESLTDAQKEMSHIETNGDFANTTVVSQFSLTLWSQSVTILQTSSTRGMLCQMRFF